MGRKKKVVTEVENKVTSVQNTQNISYTGKVTIQYERNGKIVNKTKYNAGTSALFNFLAYALNGDFTPSSEPLLLQAYETEDTSGTPIFTQSILRYESSVTSATCTKKFLIPYTLINVGVEAHCIVLMNSIGTVFAKISSSDVIFEGDGVSNIKLEWKLTLGNK